MKKQLLSVLSLVFIFSISCSEKKTNIQLEENNKKTITSSEIKTTNEENDELKNESIKTISKTDKKQIASVSKHDSPVNEEIKMLRKKHEEFLKNSPFKKTLLLSKNERKASGLPPNKYFESEWELTMNPLTGRPEFDNLRILRDKLNQERKNALETGRTPGDAIDNSWIERGPTNVGGRTRAIIFDPNDPTFNTVIAGGVSGGLWKNTNISSTSSSWTRVNIPENLNVSYIQYDPNNTNVFFVGTGESYTGGDAGGDGVWKSNDGGESWFKTLGGISGTTAFQSASYLTINNPSNIANDYASFPTTAFGSTISAPITSDIVLVVDNTAPTSDGCETITNAASLSGKIALIRRGTCNFTVKVKAAQNAGAVAVIMMNNASGVPVAMGGTDATITIPSVMISQADGDILETALGLGSVNGTLNPSSAGVVTGNIVPGIQFINDLVIRNNGGNSEIYVANGDSFSNGAYMGSSTYGIYKSTDGGSTWSLLNLPLTSAGNKHCPNDLEISTDNKIWVSTTESTAFGDGGGKIFSSSDGITFVEKYTVTGNGGGARVEIETSNLNPEKIYVLAQLNQASSTAAVEVKIIKTTDGFITSSETSLPTGDESREITYGFTGGQAFYNLMIESDPTNDQILYVGGIDLYRSSNGGNSWTAISNWTTNVHSDQHAMTFKPNNSNVAIFGNDGGVYYSGSLSTTGTAAVSRNKGFNVTQFYSLGVAPTGVQGGNLINDYFAAGAQDNGSQYFASVGSGTNTSLESQGGDGAYTMFDQGADKYYISNYVYNQSINRRTTSGNVKVINSEPITSTNGAFICPMALDSNLDILYSDYTATNATTGVTTYQIRRYTNVGLSGSVAKTLLTNALLTNPPTAITVSKYTTGSSKLYIGCRNNKLLRLTNANAISTASMVWTDLSGSGFVGSISDVELGASENEIFVTFHNYGVVSVWYSSDAGITWQNKEGNLPDLPVKCILQNPLNTNEVIIGTELGVWYTNNFADASPNWRQSYNGMSNVKVTDLDLRNDNTVFAATYGRGIFSGAFTSTSLSSDDVTKNNEIKIYPNPSNGLVNVSIGNYSGKLNIEVFDLNGRKILSDTKDFLSEVTLDFENLQTGIYILKLEGNGLNYSEKIILN